MAQVSNIDSDIPGRGQEVDHVEEGKKMSLLSTVKDKAKGTVRKLKGKVRKGSVDSEDRSGGTAQGSDDEVDDFPIWETQSGAKVDAQTTAPAEVTQKPREAFAGKVKDDPLSSFARSGTSGNSPLVAVPTSYSDPNNTMDVMPPPVIEPTSVSDLGEESSSNLGHIPEARDEEKAAVKEVQQGGPDSDINEGTKKTFKQKDLQAIDGLPKPRGFDIHSESSVKSNLSLMSHDSGIAESQDLADQAPSQEIGPNAGGTFKGAEREFPSGGAKDGTERIDQENDKPHPPGSVAEFQDSMFSSNAVHDLKPNEPAAAEAQQAGVIGTFSRGYDPEAKTSGGTDGNAGKVQHPPASKVELHENMFSSAVASDLKPSRTDVPSRIQTSAGGNGRAGDLSREADSEDSPMTFHEAPKELPPLTPTGDRRTNDGTSAGREASSTALDKMPMSDEQDAENFFDAMSDEEVLPSQRSLDSEAGKDFNPDYMAKYEGERQTVTKSARAGTDAAVSDVESGASNEGNSRGNQKESMTGLESALPSKFGSAGSSGSDTTKDSASESQAPAGDNSRATTTQADNSALSASEKLSSMISKAFGALGGTQESKTTEVDEDKNAPPAFMQ